jgi:hypothetical protein
MSGVFLFRRKEVTYLTSAEGGSGDTLLEDEDTTLPTPSDWGWPERGATALDGDGNLLKEMFWIPWETYTLDNDKEGGTTKTVPHFIAIRNEMESLIHIWPPADTSKVGKIVVPYFARILRPSEVNDSELLASKETIEALITGGEAFMMRYRHKNQPQMWIPFMKDFEKTAMKAKAAAHRNQQVFDTWCEPGEVGYDHGRGIGLGSRYLVIDVGGS